MKRYIAVFSILMLTFCNGCNDDDFLNKKPTTILTDEQVWKDKALVVSVLADLYDRISFHQHFHNTRAFADFNEAYISRNDNGNAGNNSWGYGEWGDWNYEYIRFINSFIKKLNEAPVTVNLTEQDKASFLLEARFLRAFAYFNHVKRMGGVPLILEPLTWDYSNSAEYLQFPRSKEHEVYDFVISELDEIHKTLPDNPSEKSRATKGAALALLSRAALYAGSIAKHGASRTDIMSSANVIGTPGETGIPESMATAYYEKSLAAAKAITGYSLYMAIPTNLSQNFSNLFLDKAGNTETIFIEDFKLRHKPHGFTVDSQPFSSTEESFGGLINPSLNLVQEFEMLDNTYAPLETGDDKFYDKPEDLFKNRDARLEGTVIVPGSLFRSKKVDIWGGYMLSDKSIFTSDYFQTLRNLPGTPEEQKVQVVGKDGPIPGKEFTAQTGFYIRKFLDPNKGAGSLGTQSEVAWIYFRYAEVLLNAAEASFELGLMDEAAGFMNKVRARAGFTIELTPGEITFDRIVHERKVEFAFEDQLLWDMKRWRLADKVWNESQMGEAELKSNLGKADKPMTQVLSLMPYKYYAPGDPNDGKWVFRISKPTKVTGADRFRIGNYYSEIGAGIIASNPKIYQNPK